MYKYACGVVKLSPTLFSSKRITCHLKKSHVISRVHVIRLFNMSSFHILRSFSREVLYDTLRFQFLIHLVNK